MGSSGENDSAIGGQLGDHAHPAYRRDGLRGQRRHQDGSSSRLVAGFGTSAKARRSELPIPRTVRHRAEEGRHGGQHRRHVRQSVLGPEDGPPLEGHLGAGRAAREPSSGGPQEPLPGGEHLRRGTGGDVAGLRLCAIPRRPLRDPDADGSEGQQRANGRERVESHGCANRGCSWSEGRC